MTSKSVLGLLHERLLEKLTRHLLNPLMYYFGSGWEEGRSPHPLFDTKWYLAQNPDVAEAGLNPLMHYFGSGWEEGRSPHPLFDAKWYLAQNPDVAEAGLNPLMHYLGSGWKEGRSPHPLFDAKWYLAQNPDVAGAGSNSLMHYLGPGWEEGRSPHPLFDTKWYLAQNPDVVEAGFNPLMHYLGSGWVEGHSPHPLFDAKWYLAQNSDVAEGRLNPLMHYLGSGWMEGRSPHPLFDAKWYLAQNPDIAEAGLNPLMHYLRSGWEEGRSPHPLFDIKWYLAQNPDVAEAGLNPLMHYLDSGWMEKRSPNPLFDSEWYLKTYPEVAEQDISPFLHFMQKGACQRSDPNEFFDCAYYIRNHETLWSTGEDPLVHYITFGAEEGRDPHPLFDTDWYLRQNLDVAQSRVNPLAHYLSSGRKEGRTPHPPDKYSAVCEVLDIPYEILKIPSNVKDRDVCIYVTFSADGYVNNYVLTYLAELRARGWAVVVVVTTNGLVRALPAEVTAADGLIVRINHGWDFAAWATALAALPELWTARALLMTNDSIYGPLTAESFDKTLGAVHSSNSDIVVLTDSYQQTHHYMSYFWVLKRAALQTRAVIDYMAAIKSFRDKAEVIWWYEMTMLQYFTAHGLKIDVLFPTAKDDPSPKNPTLTCWRELIDRGFPFVKVQVLRDVVDEVDASDWRDVLSFNPTLVADITRHLEVFANLPSAARFAPFPAPKRRFLRPRKLSTFYGATTAVRLKEETDLVLETPFGYVAPQSTLPQKVAAIVHIFYPDMASELRHRLENIPVETDIFVSTDNNEKKLQIEKAFSSYTNGKVTINTFPNIGRDIAPMIVGYREVFSRYEYLVHVHSKQSPHDKRFGDWRAFLLDNILGSKESVRSIIETLHETDVGILFSEHFPAVRNLINWGYNFEHMKGLLERMGVELNIDLLLEFPSSSFFWGKTAALKPLLDLRLDWDDFPSERGQVDGTLAHAIERSILFVCEAAGFRWVKASVKDHTASSRLMPVHRPTDLEPALVKAHRPLIGSAVPPYAHQAAFWELMVPATRKDARPRPRLNLLLPTLDPGKVFGGISTAMRIFTELGAALRVDFDARIIVTTDVVGLASTTAYSAYRVVALGAAYDDFPNTIVCAYDPTYGGELPIRPNDIFVATAWWTATVGHQLADAQKRYFGRENTIVYLIQDYEPGFYNWSSRYAYALSTYTEKPDIIALINSEELVNFFRSRVKFSETWVVRYAANAAIRRAVQLKPRERIILFYGRPSVDRNCFDAICSAFMLWQHANPFLADQWRIVSVGEEYSLALVRDIHNIQVAGKLTLEEYGDMLSRSLVGISLMMSPHPSYPPLEMAHAGLFTITNDYECKDLTKRSKNIISVGVATPNSLSRALASGVKEAENWVGRERQFDEINALHCEFPDYDPERLAQRLRGSISRVSEGPDSGWVSK
jgi:lipopolysaccharide biosynthesis protein/ubiquinone biosynthesis protein Coq4